MRPVAPPPANAEPPAPAAAPGSARAAPAASGVATNTTTATAAAPKAKLPPRPGPVKGPVQPGSELERQAAALERNLRRGKARSWALALGTCAALLLALVVGYLYYAENVLSYATLEPEIAIERDPHNPDRLSLIFRPTSGGRVGFRRADANRETEVLDRAADAGERTFQWRWSGVEQGDRVTVTYRQGWWLTSVPVIVPAAPPQPPLGDATVAGEVISAVTNKPLSGAEVHLAGTRLATTTDAEGRFRIEQAPVGAATIEVSAANYSTEQIEQELKADAENTMRVAMSPGLEAGQIRVVLTWDEAPADLDAHLEGPTPEGAQFHVFHKQKGDLQSREFVNLDVDDQDGEGPETITVLGVAPGRYHYFVHFPDAETGDTALRKALAQSGAEVKVYQGGQTYRFRVDGESEGNLWRVCDIVVTDDRAEVRRLDQYEFTTAEQSHVFAKRVQQNREDWIPSFGGSSDSEIAVKAGLAWLARHQADDGHWGPDCHEAKCKPGETCNTPGYWFEMAQTGLAVLAFQAGGHFYFNDKPHSENVRKGLDWLVEHQHKDGRLVSPNMAPGHHDFMYEHGMATFALAEACAVDAAFGRTANPRYREAAQKAIEFIEKMQNQDGGWRYNESPQEGSDTSVSGWPMLAIKSAKEAQLEVSPQCIERAIAFIRTCQNESAGTTGYTNRSGTHAMTGVGMLMHAFLMETPDSALMKNGSQLLAAAAESGSIGFTNHYELYNCTLAMFQAGGDEWKRWNDVVRDKLIATQERTPGSCLHGSWNCRAYGTSGGRIYATALGVLTLEVYYRYQSERARVY